MSGGDDKQLKLENLMPFKFLTTLKYLGLYNIKIQDNSLQPIFHLKDLLELEISNQFSTLEYSRLSVTLPKTKCSRFKPYIYLENPIRDKDVMVIR